MNALELLESLPGPKQTMAQLPKFKAFDRMCHRWYLGTLLVLRLIECEPFQQGFSVYRRTLLGDWLLRKIKEQDA